MARAWFRILTKIVTFSTFLLSVILLGVLSISLIGVIQHQNNEDEDFSNSNAVLDSQYYKYNATSLKALLVPKFKSIKGSYRHVIIGCIVAGICLAITQLLSSLCTLCSCSKDVRPKIKLWLIIHLIIFLGFLICLFVPWTYDFQEGEQITDFHGIKSQFVKHLEKLQEKSILETLQHELNGYYISIGLNEAFLFIIMIAFSICLCSKCGEANYEPIN